MQKYSCCDLQVLVLSEGHQLYFGPPEQVTDWFSGCLGYSFWPGQHGSVADWLMDLVSVGFSKPAKLGGTTMTSRADVVTSSELWHASRHKVLTHQLIPQVVSWTAPFCSQRKLWLHPSTEAWPELFKGNKGSSQVKGAEEDGLMIEDSTAGEEILMKEQSAPRESRHAVGCDWIGHQSLAPLHGSDKDALSREASQCGHCVCHAKQRGSMTRLSLQICLDDMCI